MPPKKKKKKTKKSKDPEQEIIELKRKELIQHAQHLTKEIVDEEKTKEEFSARLEQTKMMWDIEKNKLESKKRCLKQREDELRVLSERHVAHIDKIKGNIKYFLYKQHNEITNRKNYSQVHLYNVQDVHAENVDKKIFNVTECHNQLKESETSQNNFMFQLFREHDGRIGQLREDFKRMVNVIETNSNRNIKTIRDEKEIIMKEKVNMLEEEKERETKSIEKKHEELLNILRVQYKDRLHGELDQIEKLKRGLLLKRKAARQAEKVSKELESINKGIVEPFAKAKEHLKILNKDYEQFQDQKVKLETRKALLRVDEKKLKGLQWRHEVLFQKFELLEREYNDAQKELNESILEIQQSHSLDNMLLNKKKTELYLMAQKHILVLSKMLGSPAKDGDDSNKGIGNGVTIDDLERIQSDMQHKYNVLISQKSAKSDEAITPMQPLMEMRVI